MSGYDEEAVGTLKTLGCDIKVKWINGSSDTFESVKDWHLRQDAELRGSRGQIKKCEALLLFLNNRAEPIIIPTKNILYFYPICFVKDEEGG